MAQVPNRKTMMTGRVGRVSTLNIRHPDEVDARLPPETAEALEHCDIEFNEDDCAITDDRLRRAHDALSDNSHGTLTKAEVQKLKGEQHTIRATLFQPMGSSAKKLGGSMKGGIQSMGKQMGEVGNKMGQAGLSLRDQMEMALIGEEEDEEEEEEEEELKEEKATGDMVEDIGEEMDARASFAATKKSYRATLDVIRPPQDDEGDKTKFFSKAHSMPIDTEDRNTSRRGMGTIKAQFMTAKLRARLCDEKDGVLGIQDTRKMNRMNSIMGNKFMQYNIKMSSRSKLIDLDEVLSEDSEEEEVKEMDVEDISYVRKPNLARIIEQYEAMQNHPKYTLKQVVLSRRFHLFAHRFGNAQYNRTLVYPTLPQPEELYTCDWLMKKSNNICGVITEKQRTRPNGHRFVIAADTQFGILMDGFAMEHPSWQQEVDISRKCVDQMNAMHGDKRPLYVVVCGDLVDTESSFSGAIASWKKVMNGWERNLVFEQQVRDFKRIWAGLNPDIALVCLCGNHDVGNRPTAASIKHWTSAFGDDYLSFWVNGTYNICLNNCLFSNPTGAQDLFDEQLKWMEEQLIYARENDATHIFIYGHFPWFMKHEEEADDFLTSYSSAPAGWGPPGSSFADSYFTVPYAQRKIAMKLFKEYDVTACFSGHFHQNVVAETSWGMPMIVTGPLSMNLSSEIAHELSNGETNGIGMRVVDVGEKGKFTHKWLLLDEAEDLYESGMERVIRQSILESGNEEEAKKGVKYGHESMVSLFDDVDVDISTREMERWSIDIGDPDSDEDIDAA